MSNGDVRYHGQVWIDPFHSLQWISGRIGEDISDRVVAFDVAMAESIDKDEHHGA